MIQYKKLFKKHSKHSGRNNRGKITVYNKGGGHKRKYRLVNFLYNSSNFENESYLILDFQYDPNRNVDVALVRNNVTNQLEYKLKTEKLKIGDTIFYNKNNKKNGNIFKLKDLPLNTIVSCIEREPKDHKKGATYIRSSGSYGVIVNKYFGNKVLIKLPSGYFKFFNENCFATIGSISKSSRKIIKNNKAGRSRWLGKRPKVRGVAMNPVDHPHGGGEGKTSGGRCSVTPWGILTKGFPTKKKVNIKKIKNKSKIFEIRFNRKLAKKLH